VQLKHLIKGLQKTHKKYNRMFDSLK